MQQRIFDSRHITSFGNGRKCQEGLVAFRGTLITLQWQRQLACNTEHKLNEWERSWRIEFNITPNKSNVKTRRKTVVRLITKTLKNSFVKVSLTDRWLVKFQTYKCPRSFSSQCRAWARSEVCVNRVVQKFMYMCMTIYYDIFGQQCLSWVMEIYAWCKSAKYFLHFWKTKGYMMIFFIDQTDRAILAVSSGSHINILMHWILTHHLYTSFISKTISLEEMATANKYLSQLKEEN